MGSRSCPKAPQSDSISSGRSEPLRCALLLALAAIQVSAAAAATDSDLAAIGELLRSRNVRVVAPSVPPVVKSVTMEYADAYGTTRRRTVTEFSDYEGHVAKLAKARAAWQSDAAANPRPPISQDERTTFLAHFEHTPAPDVAAGETGFDPADSSPQVMAGGWAGHGLGFSAKGAMSYPAKANLSERVGTIEFTVLSVPGFDAARERSSDPRETHRDWPFFSAHGELTGSDGEPLPASAAIRVFLRQDPNGRQMYAHFDITDTRHHVGDCRRTRFRRLRCNVPPSGPSGVLHVSVRYDYQHGAFALRVNGTDGALASTRGDWSGPLPSPRWQNFKLHAFIPKGSVKPLYDELRISDNWRSSQHPRDALYDSLMRLYPRMSEQPWYGDKTWFDYWFDRTYRFGAEPEILHHSYIGGFVSPPIMRGRPDHTIGHWKFDEKSGTIARDASANSNDATLGGLMRFATNSAPGKIGNALLFDGIDDHLRTRSIATDGSFTVALWFRFDGNASPMPSHLIAQGREAGDGWSITIGKDNQLTAECVDSGYSHYSHTTKANIQSGTWHHVALVLKEGDFQKLYLDGMETDSDPTPSGKIITNRPILIGTRADGWAHEFNGAIDDVRLVARHMRGPEVRELYHAGSSPQGITISARETTTRTGGRAMIRVVLDTRPAADVTIALSSSDTAKGTVSPTSLTFTPANWHTPQTVTVTRAHHDLAEAGGLYRIVTDPATSADNAYHNMNAHDVFVTHADDTTMTIKNIVWQSDGPSGAVAIRIRGSRDGRAWPKWHDAPLFSQPGAVDEPGLTGIVAYQFRIEGRFDPVGAAAEALATCFGLSRIIQPLPQTGSYLSQQYRFMYWEFFRNRPLLLIGTADSNRYIKILDEVLGRLKLPETGQPGIELYSRTALSNQPIIVVRGETVEQLQPLMDRLVRQTGAAPSVPDPHVWVLDKWQRFFRDDRPGTERAVRMEAGRGEWESAQIVVRSLKGLRNFNVDAGPLLFEGTAEHPALAEPRVRLAGFRHYDDLSIQAEALFERTSRRQLLPGGPQPIWLDYRVPSTARPGLYRGEIKLTADGWQAAVPVELRVHRYVLPPEMPIVTYAWIWPWTLRQQLGLRSPQEYEAAIRRFGRDLLEHNLNMAQVVHFPMNAAEAHYRARGVTDFSDIDAECQMWFDAGMRVLVIPYVPSKPILDRSYFQDLREHLKSRGWLDRVIFYVADEPRHLPKWYEKAKPLLEVGLDATTEFNSLHDAATAKYLFGKIRTWWMSYHSNPGLELIEQRRTLGERSILHTMETRGGTTLAASAAQVRGPLWMASKWGVQGFSFWALRTITTPSWHLMTKDGSGLMHMAHCDPERQRILGTVRYERLREALDELRMLYLLKESIQSWQSAGRDASAQSAALERALRMVTDVNPPPYQEYSGRQQRYSVDPKAYQQAVQLVRSALDSLGQ